VTSPSISTIIAVRDGERYVAEAIDSVLGQTVPPDEVVVVDDGSADGSAAVAESYGPPVRCLRREAAGTGSALNAGVEASNGKLLSYVDADDLWMPQKLEVQLGAMEAGADIVLCRVEQFISPELTEAERAQLRPPPDETPGVTRGAMLIARDAHDRVGRFEEGWVVAEFIDWFGRARDAGLTEVVVPEVLLRRRIHTSNTGRRRSDARNDYPRVMRKLLERRRQAGGGG
jgi:glycosyltransferase involved in cell wall biosynthesis